MNYEAIKRLSQDSVWIDRVTACMMDVACAAVTVTGAATSGDPNWAAKQYARQVLRDPEYYVSRGLLPLALGFQTRESLAEAQVPDADLRARVQLFLSALA